MEFFLEPLSRGYRDGEIGVEMDHFPVHLLIHSANIYRPHITHQMLWQVIKTQYKRVQYTRSREVRQADTRNTMQEAEMNLASSRDISSCSTF